ncbi:hypothetical protein B0H13DRAFT_2074638 [Mycena leptocephala]|nr:hypothetical protein B0H13DRAFT_2074638 [Mycena leptocephala]
MIRSTVTVEQKDYVDRGVQTDLPRRLSRPTDSTSKPINPRVYDLPGAPSTPSNTSASRRSSSSPCFDIPYNQSPPSGSHPIPVHAAGPTRSPPTSRKHAQLPYSRPSHLNSTTQRVLSLPETSPPTFAFFSDNTIESSASAETSFLSENRSGSSRARRSFPSSDMPHTPSPPSSPESVMIIGNDMQSGWISWASSPPKPIPALHGPLSLPYARCPSGAEGTIVEGEDLSRMIWGLGIEDAGSQPAHSRANSAHVSHKSTPQSSFPPRLQAQRNSQHNTASHQHPSPRHQLQTTQDRLHPPSVGGIPTVHEARNQILLHQRALESLGPRHSSRGQAQEHTFNVPQNADSWTNVLDQLSTYDGQRGLGLDWQDTLRHQRDVADEGVRTKSPHSLKPSAAVFVPASQQATQQYPRIFVESRIAHTIHPPQRLTAIEIAHQYRAQHRPQSFLPTPPGSSSPQWTPFMPHYTDPFPPLDLHNLLPAKQQPNFTHLRELQPYTPDPSQELRQFVFDRIRNPDLNLNHDYTNMNFGDSSLVHQNQSVTPHVVSSPSQYRSPAIDRSPPHPGPPPNSPLPPIPSNRVRNFLAAPPSPTSPDLHVQSRNPTRQLRSVPFARLLQRRLSSVPEEDYMEPYSPPASPPKTAATTRPPRPPSHSLADSFRSRSHPAPNQWHAGTAGSARSGFAPQTRAAAELESDEARWRMPRTGAAKATVKLPLKTANSDTMDSRGEGSAKTDGSASENAWEKENGKPRKKVRGKKIKGGSSDYAIASLRMTSGPEAWL